ncbi:hypothetical protein C8R43DRAFT_951775 [Mycena crocata]|nr:hypothetical protein C8R43DRAFT_951775 [Mycena crocata]
MPRPRPMRFKGYAAPALQQCRLTVTTPLPAETQGLLNTSKAETIVFESQTEATLVRQQLAVFSVRSSERRGYGSIAPVALNSNHGIILARNHRLMLLESNPNGVYKDFKSDSYLRRDDPSIQSTPSPSWTRFTNQLHYFVGTRSIAAKGSGSCRVSPGLVKRSFSNAEIFKFPASPLFKRAPSLRRAFKITVSVPITLVAPAELRKAGLPRSSLGPPNAFHREKEEAILLTSGARFLAP